MKKVGFIGIGIMGKSMVRNLMKAGVEVAVYTRTKEKAEDVIVEGAVWCEDVKTCAAGRDAVITIVGYPKDVEAAQVTIISDSSLLGDALSTSCLLIGEEAGEELASQFEDVEIQYAE